MADYSKEQLKNFILDFYKTNNRAPMQSDFIKNPNLPHYQTISNALRMTWNEILQELAIPTTQEKFSIEKMSDVKVLTLFKEEMNKISKIIKKHPSRDDFNKYTKICKANALLSPFNCSWNELLLISGYEKNNIHGYIFSEKELLEMVYNKYFELGRTPKLYELENKFALQIVHFVGWNTLLKKLKLQINSESPRYNVTKEQVSIDLIKLYESLGAPPTKEDCLRAFKSSQICAPPSLYISTFGGWLKTLKSLGIPVSRSYKPRYTIQYISETLVDFTNELGRLPSVTEINKNKNLPSCSTIYRYFGVKCIKNIFEIVFTKSPLFSNLY